MRLGGPGLARHRQRPADRPRGAGRGARTPVVLAHRHGQCVGQTLRDRLLTGLGGDGDFLAVPVEHRLDGTGRAPHAAGSQRRRHIGQLQRIDLDGSQRERPQVLAFDEFGQALVAVGVVVAGRAGQRVGTQAQLDGHVHGALHPDLRDELGERGVRRGRQRLGDRHRAAVVAGVLHAPRRRRTAPRTTGAEPLGLEPGRCIELGVDAHTHLQGGGGGEHLEDRAGAVTDQRERLRLHGFAGVEVQAVGAVAGHREHRVGFLARPDHAHHAGHPRHVGVGDAVDRGLHLPLHVRVQRRPDQVAALGDLVLADPGPRQVVQRVVAEEGPVAGGDAAARQLLRLGQHAQRLGAGLAQFVGVLGQVLDHRVEHHVAPRERAVGIGIGIQCAGRLHHAGQQRGLLPVQFGGVDAEVGLGGVLNAERAVAERHQVQVAGQDLRLGERLVQRQRHPDLTQLAGRGDFDRGALLGVGLGDDQQLVVLDVLLLDRRPASGVEVARQVTRQAGQRALPVDTVVLGKAFVLDRDDRQLHRVGDLFAGHLEAALGVEPGDRVALGVDHRRHLRDLPLDQLSRAVGNDIGGAVGHQADAADDREHQTRGDDTGEQHAPGELDDRDRPRRRWGRELLRHGYRVATTCATRSADRPGSPAVTCGETAKSSIWCR